MCLLYPSSRTSSGCGKSGHGAPVVSPHAVDFDFDLEVDLDFDFDLEVDLDFDFDLEVDLDFDFDLEVDLEIEDIRIAS